MTPNGYGKMVRILGETGSDFAVGSLRRQVRGRYVERHWLRKLHAEQRLAITIDQAPDMLGNIWAVTKVFRRDFLERIGLEFPVGVRYEDQVPITRAYLQARSFDVLTDSVYLWRTRAEGTSITQQKHQAEDLRDRLAAKQQVAALLDEGASERVVSQWYTKVFRLDLMPYYRAALIAPDESYWAVLTTATAWLVEHAPARTWQLLELRFRVAAHLVARRDREALQQFLSVPQLETSNFPVVERDGLLLADLGLSLGSGHEGSRRRGRAAAPPGRRPAQHGPARRGDLDAVRPRRAPRQRLHPAPGPRPLCRLDQPRAPATSLVRRPGDPGRDASGDRAGGQPVRPPGLRGPLRLGVLRGLRPAPARGRAPTRSGPPSGGRPCRSRHATSAVRGSSCSATTSGPRGRGTPASSTAPSSSTRGSAAGAGA